MTVGHAPGGTRTLPASSFQERIWLAERLEPEAALYNVPMAWRVSPRIEPSLLRAALAMVVERHEILRTRFVEESGRLRQSVGEPWAPDVEWEDLGGLPHAERDLRLRARLREEMARSFDCGSGRLLRAALFELGRDGQVLFLCCHHLVWDEQSSALLLADLDRCCRAAAARRPPAGDEEAAGDLPASPHQERMGFVERFEKGVVYETAPTYHNLPLLLRLPAAPEAPRLRAAVEAVLARHPALRTTLRFTASGFVQHVRSAEDRHGPAPEWLPAAAATGDGSPPAALVDWTRRPLDLAGGPTFRVAAQPAPEGGCWLALVGHQAVVDRASLLVVAEELLADGPVPPGESFGAWWRARDTGRAAADAAAIVARMGREVEPLRLPARRARPPVHVYEERSVAFDLDPRLDLGEAPLLAAFAALLSLYSGQDEMVVGTVAAGRDEASGRVVGPLANLVPLRLRLAPRLRVRDLVDAVAAELAFARAHGGALFDDVVRLADPEKDMSRMALFDVLFQRVDATGAIHGAQPVELGLGHGKYDLHLYLAAGQAGTSGRLVYNGLLFDEAVVRSMAAHYVRLLERWAGEQAARVDALDPMTATERRLLRRWNATAAGHPETTLDALVRERARERPDAVAVVHGARRTTYGELVERMEVLAGGLVAAGVEPGELVALLLPRGTGQVEAILATLAAGAAYLPVDTSSPPDRVSFILRDAGARWLIADPGAAPPAGFAGTVLDLERLATAGAPGRPSPPTVHPSLPAYCIYTSGTTGGPKGVLVSHRNVVRLVVNDAFPFDFGPGDVWTLFHSYAFDFSVWELFGCLVHGGRLVVVEREEARDPAGFWRLLQRERVTVLNQTPAAFAELLRVEEADPAPLEHLRCVIFGGEKLQPRMLAGWLERRPGVRLVNMYGITETTVHSTVHTVTREDADLDASVIGRPIPTTTIHLLDPRSGREVPPGGIGEIHVGGEGVATGYRGRPSLTASRFVPNPFGEGRLYRSGDLARHRPDGTLEVIGRADAQVKLRGYRIEPGEIESCLREHPVVEDAAVVLEPEAGGRLAAAVRLGPGGATAAELRAHAAARLPAYMVPAVFRAVERIPLTENGKVDRQALGRHGTALAEATAGPLTGTASAMARIWSELLDVPAPAADASFFDLGGHSLLATRLLAAVAERLGVELPLRALFERPRLQDLADLVDERRGAPAAIARAVHPAPSDECLAPASSFQERIWFAERLEPGAATYNVPAAWRVEGRLDREALRRALAMIVQRHEILRTAFVERDGGLRLAVGEPWSPEVEAVDLGALTEAECRSRLEGWMDQAAARAFDPASGRLLRAALADVPNGEQVLLLCVHHLVWDAASEAPFLDDLAACYRPGTTPPPAPPQLAGVVRAREETAPDAGALDRWVRRLAGAPAHGALPAGPGPEPNGAVPLPVRDGLLERLQRVGAERGVSWFMVAAAALATLLHETTGQEDVTFGCPVANRETDEEAEVIGPCLNLVVLRSRLGAGATLGDLLDDMRERVLEALEDQHVPFEAVVERLRPPRHPGRTPYVDVTLNVDVLPEQAAEVGGVPLRPLALESHWRHETKFGVTVTLLDRAGRLSGVLSYRGDRISGAGAERLAARLAALLEAFTGDLGAPALEAPAAEPPPPRGQYRDFVLAQERRRATDGGRGLEDRVASLRGAPAYPDVAPPRRPGEHGSVPIPLRAGTGAALRRIQAAHGVSRFMVVATAVAALLHRWTGQDDVTFGVPVADREGGLAGVIGPCMNTVVLRSRCEATTDLGELLRRTREAVLAAGEHRHVPFEEVVGRLNPPRRAGWTPYVDVTLATQEEDARPPRLHGSDLAPLAMDETGADHLAKFGLLIGFTARGDELDGVLAHRGDRFTGADARQLARLLGRILDRFPEALDRPVAALDLLDEEERRRLAVLERGGPAGTPTTVADLLARRLAERPDAPAVESSRGVLTHRELDARATGLAARLVPHRGEREPVVAILLSRGEDAVVAMLAAWRAGCAFSTLDPRWPRARIDLLLDDLEPCAAIAADAELRRGLSARGIPVVGPAGAAPDARAGVRLPAPPGPEDAAYVLYTSGTTGRPKGVVVRHRSLAQLVAWAGDELDVGPGDRASQVAALTFDPSQCEIWSTLCAGAVLVPYEQHAVIAAELAEWLDERGITLCFAPTLLAEALWATGATLPSLRLLYFAGSALTRWPAEAMRGRVLNAYGPTETTVFATAHEPDEDGAESLNCIGRPIAGTTVHVLDPLGGRCPVGVPGEIHVGGAGVAAGYWRRPELTRERFPDGGPGAEPGPLYRTGDRGRWLAGGGLEFQGRLDRQLKVRGYRIEPGEVEAHLLRDPLVARVLVAGLDEPPSLVAYAVARPGAAADARAVLDRLAAQLPGYLVPDALLWLDELPATGEGKLDADRLPRPARADLAGGTPWVAPRSDLERRIAGAWTRVLGLDSVGVHDNFFDLGGNSLLLAALHAELREALGTDLPVRRLFEHPTVHALAAALSDAPAGDDGDVRARAARARQARSGRDPRRVGPAARG